MISSKIIAHSVSEMDKHIITYELEYPRFIHAEFMTHRLFSRNAASSRAIPIEKMLEMVGENPASPEVWGKNQSGMQAKEVFEDYMEATAMWAWQQAANKAIEGAKGLNDLGLHKQIVNRVLEPFAHIKVVLTTTEIENFFWLRCDEHAQPEIKILAEQMEDLYRESTPIQLRDGEWHTPYYAMGFWAESDVTDSLEDALAISSSCCAQVSYRTLDDSLDKAQRIFDRLITSKPPHASPMEHQATPITKDGNLDTAGVTHYHKTCGYGSGNLYGWVQHRQLLDEHCKW